MEAVQRVLIAIATLFSLTFIFVVGGTFLGGVIGWLVGLFFGDQILNIFAQFGIHDVTMFQVGLFLGFVAGFFRTYQAHRIT